MAILQSAIGAKSVSTNGQNPFIALQKQSSTGSVYCDTPKFQTYGAFFSDLVPQARREIGYESGRYLIDKTRCARELRMALWYAEHSDFVFGVVCGDYMPQMSPIRANQETPIAVLTRERLPQNIFSRALTRCTAVRFWSS